ncbi:VOC family protein [Candidatus Daviesbacteria bacterium]|nr:VOC family protein [Candidatus Daviesbacteria bacterium]
MFQGIESIILFSEDAKKLADFYKEKVGLKLTLEAEMGEENTSLYGFDFGGGPGLYMMNHSKVKGSSQEPERFMFNLEVSGNIEEAVKKLEDAGVKKIQDIYHIENYGYIATFEDIDGNYFQLVKTKP